MIDELKYQRILLKLGGEALSGPQGFGIDPNQADDIARRIAEVKELRTRFGSLRLLFPKV